MPLVVALGEREGEGEGERGGEGEGEGEGEDGGKESAPAKKRQRQQGPLDELKGLGARGETRADGGETQADADRADEDAVVQEGEGHDSVNKVVVLPARPDTTNLPDHWELKVRCPLGIMEHFTNI